MLITYEYFEGDGFLQQIADLMERTEAEVRLYVEACVYIEYSIEHASEAVKEIANYTKRGFKEFLWEKTDNGNNLGRAVLVKSKPAKRRGG